MADFPNIPATPNFRMPTLPVIKAPDPPAKWMYERIVRQINRFEQGLAPDEEVGGRLIAAAGEGVIHIEDVGYWGPDLIIFSGTNPDGRKVQVLQHYTQVSITLTALPVQKDEPRRIGFHLVGKLDEK